MRQWSSISSSLPSRVLPKSLCAGSSAFISKPGASQKVHFELKDRDLGMVTEDGNPIVAARRIHGQHRRRPARYGSARRERHFQIEGQLALPEYFVARGSPPAMDT
jgi:hypothetical protein